MKKEKTTFGDRVASSFVMLLASFITALIIWGFVFLFVVRAGEVFIFPFNFVIYFTAALTALAFISPNASLNSMGWVWKKIENIIKALKNDNGAW